MHTSRELAPTLHRKLLAVTRTLLAQYFPQLCWLRIFWLSSEPGLLKNWDDAPAFGAQSIQV